MRIHVIGVCGTGMAALAGLLKAAGHELRGSDASPYPPMSTLLEREGIACLKGYVAENLAWGPEVVVVGNIARKDNPEAVEAQRLGLKLHSLPSALHDFFLTGRTPLVVTGTHGKTTTSSLLAWLLTV
jgi:UDP-N-acetylmuramate: L-alanyl-gamma-D-glutamyl-meso-diaminopimelate ligase